ncbi:MAG: HaeIII family restriction endonuclease [Kiritimatiellae bacterium]|nr:HaeIII family restriction endonuclease [Kiritimatiellia bacterium]
MAQDTTKNGKAFEYACLLALQNAFVKTQNVCVDDSPQLRTAKNCYLSLTLKSRRDMSLAAEAMRRVIVRLEPKLENFKDGDILTLALQGDQRGQAGDVRDILCMRIGDKWEIGISCKHNHSAVKHSRLAEHLDFGKKWVSCPCSDEYFKAVGPIFASLSKLRTRARRQGRRALWSDLDNKEQNVYVPILDAFQTEMHRMYQQLGEEFAPRLARYLLGENDFYKAISDDRNRSTRIEAYNISGTLGESANGKKSLYGRAKLRLPSRIVELRYKDGSQNTVELICDRGWQFSFRIHNASSEIEPSLKFDIQLVSQLSSHASVNIDEPWINPPVERRRVFEAIPVNQRYVSFLPLYSLKAACGVLGGSETVKPEGWIEAVGVGKLDDTMAVVRAAGDSMEPEIHDGEYCIVRKLGAVDYNNRIVLVQRNDQNADPESGGAYLLKKFVRYADKIVLKSINSKYSDIPLDDPHSIKLVAYFYKTLHT